MYSSYQKYNMLQYAEINKRKRLLKLFLPRKIAKYIEEVKMYICILFFVFFIYMKVLYNYFTVHLIVIA